ncbi:hypothetical protein HZB07_06060, partial [Candidatus Saganbacteria bacterium]|nr:hypothetical protein [Candidatus Saganbacteria bacterium]
QTGRLTQTGCLTGFEKLPRYLQEIIAKALQPDPQLRFAAVQEFSQSLAAKILIAQKLPQAEYKEIFDNTVTQYGAQAKIEAKQKIALEELSESAGRVHWNKEPHRLWILFVFLILAIAAGLVYAFLVGQ